MLSMSLPLSSIGSINELLICDKKMRIVSEVKKDDILNVSEEVNNTLEPIKKISLKEIDERLMTIDDFLDD